MDSQDETNVVSRGEINRLKLLANPFLRPAWVVCGLGCIIGGGQLAQIAQIYWHWPIWLVMIVGVPTSIILGWIMTGLVVIGIVLFKDRHHV